MCIKICSVDIILVCFVLQFVFVIEVMIYDQLLVSYEYIGKYGCVLYVIGQVCIIYIDLFKGIFRLKIDK